jgi:hemolysin III
MPPNAPDSDIRTDDDLADPGFWEAPWPLTSLYRGANRARLGPREPFCAVSHFAGFLMSVAALPVLLVAASGDGWRTLGAIIYGISLILLYGSSTLYHGAHASRSTLARLQRLDHIAIFLLIFGTYAPLCLNNLRGPVGWGLLAAEGTLATIGIVLAAIGRTRAVEAVRVGLYLVMGWLVVAVAGPVREALPPAGFAWLLAGGLAYSVGAVIFATDRPHLWPGRFSAHDLWHLFVLAGSVLHFGFIWRFVAGAPAMP